MPSGSPEWPEARTLRLRELWDDGVSVTAIGVELGVTRNSVIGKKNRLVAAGYPLAPRHDPIIRDGVAKRPYQRAPHLRPPKPQPLPLPPLASLVALVAETRIPTPTPAPVVVVEMVQPEPKAAPAPRHPARGECQFISGDTRGKWRFCGEPCVMDARGLPSSWCAKHFRLACVPRSALVAAA